MDHATTTDRNRHLVMLAADDMLAQLERATASAARAYVLAEQHGGAPGSEQAHDVLVRTAAALDGFEALHRSLCGTQAA